MEGAFERWADGGTHMEGARLNDGQTAVRIWKVRLKACMIISTGMPRDAASRAASGTYPPCWAIVQYVRLEATREPR